MVQPIKIEGSTFSDTRGKMKFFNTFDMAQIVRFYEISPASTKIIRGWQGHYNEKKWFYCHTGSFIINTVSIKDNDKTINNRMPERYVLKENTVSEIVQCVKAVLSGEYYLSPAISQYLIRRNSGLMNEASDKHGINLLTDSEKKILKLVSDMKTNQEIAKHLSISSKTVKNHRNNICNKLGLTGTHALLKYAIQNESNLD